ncbi:T9SS type A sorting domain-containing protein [Chryseobacterium sp. MIQD13]|uniref:T9SS type A sorting domain-containing protein n=1 Tax=Chryseobacterium sp. MIQD13 TaxID=3422310 RepID=UPI003D2E3D36
MKFIKYLFLIGFFAIGKAQVLSVPQIIQEQDQWCWAASSKTILDYYGFPKLQCEIAEYTRTTATFHNFGSTKCCVSTTAGCNYWNYLSGYSGSIQNILSNFGSITTSSSNSSLTLSQINTEIANKRPFVIRWGWATGGGHFVVGHGVSGNNVYYMNPWFGEGKHISTYSWVVADGNHTWTHSLRMTKNPNRTTFKQSQPENNADIITSSAEISPNPAKDFINIKSDAEISSYTFISLNGNTPIKDQKFEKDKNIDVSFLQSGIYIVNLKMADGNIITTKFIKE